jgi:hypothetical protein
MEGIFNRGGTAMTFRKFFCLAALAVLSTTATNLLTQVAFSGYIPTAAVNYARKYAYKVVSDGYFWAHTGYATYYGAGTPVPSGGYDCAHFVSSCIGDEEHEQGGGLDVPDRAGTYGEPGANKLCTWLLNDSGVGVQKSSVDGLSAGDVIGYDWDQNGWIDHVTLYLGGGLVASHSSSQLDYPWDYNGTTFTGTYVHIVPEPATWALVCSGALIMGLASPIRRSKPAK